jgi:glycosyltransferase involved in cell wall biosynthesis
MGWLHRQPDVDLHTVLWSRGHNPSSTYDFGRFANVADAHEALLPTVLRAVGLTRIGGGLAGRGVRAALRSVPTTGVLYLSTSFSAPVLRYLPPGERTVVTHLHTIDREADPPVPPDRVAQLREATHVWLAVDETTRTWAVEAWDLDPAAIALVPEPVDSGGWNRAARHPDPTHVRLGVRGGAWFRSDHTARLVQQLRRKRPDLQLDLVWAEVIGSPDHLAPLRHDLEHLGVAQHLELPRSADEVLAALDDIDVLVMTTPDDEGPWAVHDALARGVPAVCFDTHRMAADLHDLGIVVPYLDVAAMADAVLGLHADEVDDEAPGIARRRAELRRRDVSVVGPRIVELATGASA